jgi:hypothetical protein
MSSGHRFRVSLDLSSRERYHEDLEVGRMKRLRQLTFVPVSLALMTGCRDPQPKLVPISEVEPLMTYQNSSPRFSLKVFMYAPGNFVFQNLLPRFSLVGLPDITSPTGRVLQTRLLGREVIEFNLLLPGQEYRRSSNDLRIPWELAEKGPQGFLRSEGSIFVDITATADSEYFIREVRYQPASE